jgi:hypothetical protein
MRDCIADRICHLLAFFHAWTRLHSAEHRRTATVRNRAWPDIFCTLVLPAAGQIV